MTAAAATSPAPVMGTPVDSQAPAAPRSAWSGAADRWVLSIGGNWRGRPAALADAPAAALAMSAGSLTVDASELGDWDVGLASALWQRLGGRDWQGVQVDLRSLPPALMQILALASPPPGAATPVARARTPGWLAVVGGQVRSMHEHLRETLAFVGEVLLSLGRLMRGRSDMRLSDFIWQLDQTGPRSLPIVALVSFLVGLIVAYMGAAQLQRFGAQSYIADLVTVGVVREIAALMVGIVLAGRVGAAFAAQIGSMRANEEVDALTTLGIDPVDHLVLPRVLALLVVGPLLTAFAALVGMAVGWLVAVGIYGVTPLEYLYKSVEALTLPHVLIGLLKGTVYSVLVALAGCRQGLSAGRSAQAVGDATTASVVQSIVWIVLAASALTVIFQRLDW